MQLFQFRNLHYLLREVSLDNNLEWDGLVVVPEEFEEACALAEKELETFTLSDYEAMAAGNWEDQEPLRKRAPTAAQICDDEFNCEGFLKCFRSPGRFTK